MRAVFKDQKVVVFLFDSIKTFNYILVFKFKMNIDFILQHFQRISCKFLQFNHFNCIAFLWFVHLRTLVHFAAVARAEKRIHEIFVFSDDDFVWCLDGLRYLSFGVDSFGSFGVSLGEKEAAFRIFRKLSHLLLLYLSKIFELK